MENSARTEDDALAPKAWVERAETPQTISRPPTEDAIPERGSREADPGVTRARITLRELSDRILAVSWRETYNVPTRTKDM